MLGTSVVGSAVVLIVLESEVVLGVIDALEELRLVVAAVVVAAAVEGAVSTMIVARSNVCVFGIALALSPHML